MRRRRAIVIALFLSCGVVDGLHAQLRLRTQATGFSSPLAIVQDPTDRNVQFVVQQGGRIRVIRNGEAVTNWGIHSGSIMWDASGNLEYFSSSKVITNDWMVHQLFRPLDPAKTWRFRANFALDSGFPQTNLFSFIVPWPLQGTIQTNLGGLPARIRFVNGDMLDVELVSQPADKRLTFISAFDGTGANLVHWVHGSWGQHSFWRGLELSKPTEVHATVAIHRNYQAEFTLQPRYEKPSGHVEAKGAQSPR